MGNSINGGACFSEIRATDSYGDGVNAFFKVEKFDPSGIPDGTTYYPAAFGFGGSMITLFGDDSDGYKVRISVVPSFKDSYEPCDVGVNAEVDECAVINEPWELAWMVQRKKIFGWLSSLSAVLWGC